MKEQGKEKPEKFTDMLRPWITPGCTCDRWGHPSLDCVEHNVQVQPKFSTKRGQHLVAPRNEIGNIVKEKLVLLFRRIVPFARNEGGNRGNDNEGELRPKFEWPYVMNSSVAMHGPLVSGTWIWHHQHVRWHHGYYRTRR